METKKNGIRETESKAEHARFSKVHSKLHEAAKAAVPRRNKPE